MVFECHKGSYPVVIKKYSKLCAVVILFSNNNRNLLYTDIFILKAFLNNKNCLVL